MSRMTKVEARARLFVGTYPEGFSYADRAYESGGDYRKLAFLSFRTGELRLEKGIHPCFEALIREDAKRYQIGQTIEVSTSGQTVTFGYEKIGTKVRENHRAEWLREAVKYSPQAQPKVAGLVGNWTRDGFFLCATCSARLLARGFWAELYKPVWAGETIGVCVGHESECESLKEGGA